MLKPLPTYGVLPTPALVFYFCGTACAFFFFQEGARGNRFFLFGAVKKKKAGAPVRSCPRPRRAGYKQIKFKTPYFFIALLHIL
jgi:hypothetical protein